MSPANLLKAGFVQIDTATGVTLRTLSFQYNPDTLTRRLEVLDPTSAPREIVSFTVSFDATDKLEAGDPQAEELGILPALSALQLLLYPVANSLLVWVAGRRIAPVRITEMHILEQSFDTGLNPIRAQIGITLQLLKDADLTNNPRGKAVWNEYFAQLQQLAQMFASEVPAGALGEH
jgi:hypothetical protein